MCSAVTGLLISVICSMLFYAGQGDAGNRQNTDEIRNRIEKVLGDVEPEKQPKTSRENEEIWAAIAQLRQTDIAIQDNAEFQQEEITTLQKDIDQIETEVLKLKTVTESLDNDNDQYKMMMAKIEEQAVGFTACALEFVSYELKDVIKFELIRYNVGNHFNVDSGEFTCPYHGVYLFSVVIPPFTVDHSSGAAFMLDGTEVLQFAMTSGLNDLVFYETTSASIVIECKAGQKMWMESTFGYTVLVDVGAGYASFSGTLLNRLDF